MYLLSKATSLKTFFTQMLAYYKILRTFASLLKGSTLTKEFWRGGRVVDCGGLENRCTARYPGFESLSLRNKGCKSSICKIYTLFYTQKSTTGCSLYALFLVILFISFLTLLYFIFSFCN